MTRRNLALLVAIVLAAGALAFDGTLVGVFYDDGLYASLAVALAGGQGYVHAHLPGAPSAVHYPPLYPMVLAPFFGLLPVSAAALGAKLLNLVLSATAAGLVAWHAARSELLGDRAPRWLAPVVVGAAALGIPVLATQAVLFAEPLFALLLAAAIVCADRERPLAAGSAAALALLTRSIGVAAAAGIVLYLALVRRAAWRTAVVAAVPPAVAGLGWGVWILVHQNGIDPALALNYGSYGAVFAQAGLAAFGASFFDLARPLAAITLGWLVVPVVYRVFAIAALAVGLYGLAILTRRSAVGWTLIAYLAILAVWPYPPDRFLWAVLPWLALAWTAGALDLARRARLRLPIAVLATCVAVGYGVYEARGFARRWWGTTARGISANFRELLPAVAALPPDAVVATEDEALVWLYTGRRAVPFYLYAYRGRETVEPAPAEQRAYLARWGVTHVLLTGRGSGSDRELDALLGAYPGWLSVTQAWPGGRLLFRVGRSP